MREAFEEQRNFQRSAADFQRQDDQAAQRRAQARAAAEENRRMAELKRRIEFSEQVKDKMKQEMNIQKSKHTIQSSLIR